MTKSKGVKDTEEAKRWLIIGAYKAGANEKKMAKLSGLSKQVIRHIILNYQKTGKPSLPKKDKAKNKLIVEYDEDGEIIDSDDDDENDLKEIKTTKDLIHYTKLKISKQASSSSQVKNEEKSSSEPTIKGYETWTKQDDLILLQYVLNDMQDINSGWNELQIRFNNKHSASTCYQRWHRLKRLLIKNINTI